MLQLRLLRLKLQLPALARPASRIRRARSTVLWFFAALSGLNVALSIAMDTVAPKLRDADYVSRRECIVSRAAANPGRPLVIALGSSRSDHGIRPLVLGDDGPLLVNSSQVGAGPLLQLLTLKRLLADGIAPEGVLVEFWPPFLHGKGTYSEFGRIDPHRLFPGDEAFIRDYHPDPDEVLRLMREIRRTPFWNHRQRLMSQTLPTWLPFERRLDGGFAKLDAAGWMPGLEKVTPEARALSVTNAGQYYQPLLAQFEIDPKADRALREILTTCRQRGIAVKLLWLPESSEFRSWYPPESLAKSNALLSELVAKFGVDVIRARDWMADECFVDGYHLTQSGAAGFTTRLAPHLPARP